jgi:hypothetical protein
MSVYKEGYEIINTIMRNSKQIYSDACDLGRIPTRKGDKMWVMVKQLIEMYGVDGTRYSVKYATGTTVIHDIELTDEWAVDRVLYRVVYVTVYGDKNIDGYFYLTKL